jgi:hypothetical protein
MMAETRFKPQGIAIAVNSAASNSIILPLHFYKKTGKIN